ncbi:hypothetical protein [Nocardioides psychrotolerans]|uniref:hypothetical protein n=1 Tax=Nocardioides psychrotolerans TaxID=1005945 RepID=UPI003137CFE1
MTPKTHVTSRQKVGFLGLASLAILGSLTAAGPTNSAFAAASATCDAALFTIRAEDSVTGAVLAGARFQVKSDLALAATTFVRAGNHVASGGAFKDAFVAQDDGFYTTPQGQALQGASQETLGTNNKPLNPPDITGTLSINGLAAYLEWVLDADGRIAAFKADVERRLAALQAADAAFPDLATQDPLLDAHIAAEIAKLVALLVNIDVSLNSAGNLLAFETAYDQFTNPANWTYGLSENPSVALKDDVVARSWPDSSSAAAAAVQALPLVSGLTTDAGGETVFTTFGVAQAYADRNTHGDTTCSQQVALVSAIVAPVGYVLDGVSNTFTTVASDGTGIGSITFTFTPESVVDPVVPVITSTGL